MNESWGLQIFDESVETIVPQPRENGVTVFSLTNCKIAFNHAPFLEYVICLDERTMAGLKTTGICRSAFRGSFGRAWIRSSQTSGRIAGASCL